MNLYVEIREEATRIAREVQRLKWDHTHTHTHKIWLYNKPTLSLKT